MPGSRPERVVRRHAEQCYCDIASPEFTERAPGELSDAVGFEFHASQRTTPRSHRALPSVFRSLLQLGPAAQVRAENLRDLHLLVRGLVVLDERGEQPRRGDRRVVERVRELTAPSVSRYLMLARRACQSCRVEQLCVSRYASRVGIQDSMSFIRYLPAPMSPVELSTIWYARPRPWSRCSAASSSSACQWSDSSSSALQMTNCSTFSNWCTRSSPRTSRPALPASRRVAGRDAGVPDRQRLRVECALLRPTDAGLTATLATAGHPPALVRRGSGLVEAYAGPNPIVGVFADARFAEVTLTLDPGDLMLLHTDGLTDARAPTGERVGEARVHELVASLATPDAAAAIAAFDALLDANEITDDVAIVAVTPSPS